jgi:hypothetical protein
MGEYGHVLIIMLPFFVIGLVLAVLRYWRSGEARVIIAAMLAGPSASALINLGVSRVLVMVIPIVILSGLGLFYSFTWLTDRKILTQRALAVSSFVILTFINVYMLRDALVNGPLWSENYSLSGMQYGARQVFSEVQKYLDQSPDIEIELSPNWTNGTTEVARFFLDDPMPIRMNSIDHYLNEIREIDENHLFILDPEAYEKADQSGKFTDIVVEQIIDYPNGSPGFYFIRLNYVDNIVELMNEEIEQRRWLEEGVTQIAGENATVNFSFIDMGRIEDIFDGEPSTLIRTAEANPLIIQVEFDRSITISGLSLRIGGGPADVEIELFIANTEDGMEYFQHYERVSKPRNVEIDFNGTFSIDMIRVGVKNSDDGEPSHVHLWEFTIIE